MQSFEDIVADLLIFSPIFGVAAAASLLLLANAIRRTRKGVDVGLAEWLAPAGCLVAAGVAAAIWRLAAIPGRLDGYDCNPQSSPFLLAGLLERAELGAAFGTWLGAVMLVPALFFVAAMGAKRRDGPPKRVWVLRAAAVVGAAGLLGWLWLVLPTIVFDEMTLGDVTQRPFEMYSRVPGAKLRVLLYPAILLFFGLALARASRFEAPRGRMLGLTAIGLLGVGLVALSTHSTIMLPILRAYESATLGNVETMVIGAVSVDMLQPWWLLATVSTALVIAAMGAAATSTESGQLRLPSSARAMSATVALGLILGGLYWQRDTHSDYFTSIKQMATGPFAALDAQYALPRSTSNLPYEGSITIEANRSGVRVVDGLCKVGMDGPYTVEFVDGALPQADRSGDVIAELADQLEQSMDERKRHADLLNQRFEPTVLLVVERTAPLRHFARIIETARSSDLWKFKIAIAKVENGYPALERSQRNIGVINMTAPRRQPHVDGVTVIDIRPRGFRIEANGAWLPAQNGCPPNGPTICLTDTKATPTADFQDARDKTLTDNPADAHASLEQAIGAYDFIGLYRLLERVKAQAPEERIIEVRGAPDIPLEMLARVIDTARHKRALPEDTDKTDLWEATLQEDEPHEKGELFPDAVLGLVPFEHQ